MPEPYLLAGGSAELERLRLQARVWEADAEAMLDRIGVAPGWRCVDLGCGGMGILGPLSRRVGATGRVVGVDTDAQQLASARDLVRGEGLANVEVVAGDAYATGFPDAAFDLAHVRFVYAPVGRDAELLREQIRLVRPGGVVAIQEPDAASWSCQPAHPDFAALTGAIRAAFAASGGDFDAGRRAFAMLRAAGLRDVQARAGVVALTGTHPYKRLPVQFATSLRRRILDGGILDEAALDAAIAGCERVAADPGTLVLSFTVVQVWGRVAGG